MYGIGGDVPLYTSLSTASPRLPQLAAEPPGRLRWVVAAEVQGVGPDAARERLLRLVLPLAVDPLFPTLR